MSDPERVLLFLCKLRKSKILFPVLAVCSFIYRMLVSLRRFLYTKKIIRAYAPAVNVISIGNITTGGTGKTVAVVHLATFLKGKFEKVVILLRGYQRKNTSKRIVVVSDGNGRISDWRETGDEAYMLAEALPDIPIIVGADRARSSKLAVEKFGAQAIILDDGFQHMALRRNHDIVLVDATNPFDNGWCLPLGNLRESRTSLKNADQIILTRVDQVPAHDLKRIHKEINEISLKKSIVEATHHPQYFVSLKNHKRFPVPMIQGKKIYSLSGIANPGALQKTLENLGATILGNFIYPDHHNYSLGDIKSILSALAQTSFDYVITTQKDSVRLASLSEELPSTCYYLKIEFEFLNNKTWEDVLQC